VDKRKFVAAFIGKVPRHCRNHELDAVFDLAVAFALQGAKRLPMEALQSK